MARKPSVPYLPGTDVLDLQKYRSIQRIKEILHPMNVEDSGFMHFDASDFDHSINMGYQPIEGKNILGHHERMMKATEELRRKASWAKTKNSPAPKST